MAMFGSTRTDFVVMAVAAVCLGLLIVSLDFEGKTTSDHRALPQESDFTFSEQAACPSGKVPAGWGAENIVKNESANWTANVAARGAKVIADGATPKAVRRKAPQFSDTALDMNAWGVGATVKTDVKQHAKGAARGKKVIKRNKQKSIKRKSSGAKPKKSATSTPKAGAHARNTAGTTSLPDTVTVNAKVLADETVSDNEPDGDKDDSNDVAAPFSKGLVFRKDATNDRLYTYTAPQGDDQDIQSARLDWQPRAARNGVRRGQWSLSLNVNCEDLSEKETQLFKLLSKDMYQSKIVKLKKSNKGHASPQRTYTKKKTTSKDFESDMTCKSLWLTYPDELVVS